MESVIKLTNFLCSPYFAIETLPNITSCCYKIFKKFSEVIGENAFACQSLRNVNLERKLKRKQ